MDPLVMSVAEVAKVLDLCENSVYEAIRRGDIPSRKLGSRVIVPRAEFLRWLGVDEEKPTADVDMLIDLLDAQRAAIDAAIERLQSREQ